CIVHFLYPAPENRTALVGALMGFIRSWPGKHNAAKAITGSYPAVAPELWQNSRKLAISSVI
ncbi:MAG: hypothetical protein VXY46_07270, partial [Pseudomonadota bacterium]|nr:hypothetical protein [Pseudomonadota bacterium]